MAENDINPCGICIRILLVFINILYLLIACGITGVGIFFLVKESDSSLVFGGVNLFAVAIAVTVVGFVIFFIAILGIIGAIGNLWPVLSLYSFLLILIILGQLAGGIFAFVYKDRVEAEIDVQILTYIKNYTTSDNLNYNEGTNDAIDILQETFKCCGLTGPGDWLLYNPKYVLTNGVPGSCACDGDSSQCLTILHSNVGVWKKGCNETVYEFAKKNILAFGGAAFGFATLQILTLFLSIGLCCCGMVERSSRRRYVHMTNDIENDTIQVVQDGGWSHSKEFQTGYSNVV